MVECDYLFSFCSYSLFLLRAAGWWRHSRISVSQMGGNRVCQICDRRFSNGQAMGGHLRSHFAKLFLPTNNAETHKSTPPTPPPPTFQPRRKSHGPQSYISPHPPLFPVEDSDPSSRDSPASSKVKPGAGIPETERKRGHESPEEAVESPADSGRVSVVPDLTSSDKEGAACLMMLSRDAWPSAKTEVGESRDREGEDFYDDHDEPISLIRARERNRGRFKCKTCDEGFCSYQALGGHSSGHKKVKLQQKHEVDEGGGNHYFGDNGNNNNGYSRRASFECPHCDKVFESGQALGGHKKVHVQLSGKSQNYKAAA